MLRKILLFCLFVVLLTSCIPYCSDAGLVPPGGLDPSIGETMSSPRPRFSWNFEPDPICKPYMYVVLAGTDPLLNPSYPSTMNYIESSEGELSITPYYDAFEDCDTYYWHVRAGGLTVDVFSHTSMFKTDFLGTCIWPTSCPSGIKPPSPDLLFPFLGQTVNTLNPDLVWQGGEPVCEPGDYYFELSDSPDFIDHILEGYTTDTLHWEPSIYLENCGHYYWRVTARNIPNTSHSMIHEFWTDMGGCSILGVCLPDQLVADTLIYPVENEVVTDPRPYLVWKRNLPDCVPMMSYLVVSEHADFSDHVISSNVVVGGEAHIDSTVFSTPVEVYRDCKTYYWKTRIVAAGGDIIWSDVASFRTAFGFACPWSGLDVEEATGRIRFDCINPNTSVIIFDLPTEVKGEFAAKIDNLTWNCSHQPGSNQRLICTGPHIRENVSKQVVLLDLTTQKSVLTAEVTTPICEISAPTPSTSSSQCQPTIPCMQFGTGCVWNSNSCRCEKNGQLCP